MHTPSRQDAQGHLQRLVRRRGVAAAAGAAVAAARLAAGGPRRSPAPVNYSLHVSLYRTTDTDTLVVPASVYDAVAYKAKQHEKNVTDEFGKALSSMKLTKASVLQVR